MGIDFGSRTPKAWKTALLKVLAISVYILRKKKSKDQHIRFPFV